MNMHGEFHFPSVPWPACAFYLGGLFIRQSFLPACTLWLIFGGGFFFKTSVYPTCLRRTTSILGYTGPTQHHSFRSLIKHLLSYITYKTPFPQTSSSDHTPKPIPGNFQRPQLIIQPPRQLLRVPPHAHHPSRPSAENGGRARGRLRRRRAQDTSDLGRRARVRRCRWGTRRGRVMAVCRPCPDRPGRRRFYRACQGVNTRLLLLLLLL